MAGMSTADGPRAATELIGRRTEVDALTAFADAVHRGPAMAVLEGESGVGKSTLWREGLRIAQRSSFTVIDCRLARAEAQLAFTALSDLLAEVPEDVLGEIPSPQRRALEIALLRAEPEGDELLPRAVALGFLGVLGALARRSPLVVGIDDVHWLDPASEAVISFAVRRLRSERVGILVTRRAEGGSSFPPDISEDDPIALTVLRLASLPAHDVDALLQRALGDRLDRRSLQRAGRSSGGNPLFALQLGRAILEHGGDDDALVIPATLQQIIADRLTMLRGEALHVVQIAAALAHPTASIVDAVAPGETSDGLAAATAAGVLLLDGDRVQFTHPILATAAYAQMLPAERRQLHARLAAIIDDVEERARHLAAAAEQPDSEVASALDAAASRARSRGAPAAAAELWAEAARLTPDHQSALRWERLLQEAECLFGAGETAHARTLLEDIAGTAAIGTVRVRALLRLAWVVSHIDGFVVGAAAFRRALDEPSTDERATAELEQGLAWSLHESVGVAAALPHARRASDLATTSGDARLIAETSTLIELLNSLSGRGLAAEAVGRIASTVDASSPEILVRPRWSYGMLLEWADRLDEARQVFDALHHEANEQGDEHSLPFILFHLARTQLLSGAWPEALESTRACVDATHSSGQASERPFACVIRALVDAHLGLVDPTSATITEGLELAARFGVLPARLELLATRGFLELSIGRHDDADRTLAEVAALADESGFREPAMLRYHGDALETKLALGRIDEAAALIDDVERMARTYQRPSLHLIGGRGRGLLLAAQGQVEQAGEALTTALAEDRSGQPFERARTLLTLGSVQRRNRQKRSAREALEAAQRVFVDLQARLWVDKATTELTRIGGRAPADGLTPTELQIARLIAAGRSYREVAAELFISPKTVQWNLSKVYRKLDIQSRAELPGRLDAG